MARRSGSMDLEGSGAIWYFALFLFLFNACLPMPFVCCLVPFALESILINSDPGCSWHVYVRLLGRWILEMEDDNQWKWNQLVR